MNYPQSKKVAAILALLVFVGATCIEASSDPFPSPGLIAPNIAFWTKVYSQYTTRQGIVHDNEDLEIIYEVIDLLPYDQPGAAKINRLRMKRANEKYEHILRSLAKHPHTSSAESRRVAELFGEPLDPQRFAAAAHRVRCQVGQKDRFRAGLIRSGAYIDQIRDIFKTKGLPEDLAFLPHVESSFNPNAYSKFGAAGMWQFTRSTGKRFMEVGYALDERRDPILATYAAAQLLEENYSKLGCWALAITAYNHGAAGMQRAQSRHGDYAEIFRSYRGRTFKFASRNFYSEFLAARQVAANYRDYFGDLDLERPVPTRTIVLQGYAAIDDLSRHLQISPETLKQMNPALRQPVFDGQKLVPRGYSLRLPRTSDDSEESLVASLLPSSIYHSDQKPSKFYTVQRGDTAGRIARVHGVQLSELILANNLDRRATIYPRQTLRIPLPGEHLKEPTAPVAVPEEPILVAQAETAPAATNLSTAEPAAISKDPDSTETDSAPADEAGPEPTSVEEEAQASLDEVDDSEAPDAENAQQEDNTLIAQVETSPLAQAAAQAPAEEKAEMRATESRASESAEIPVPIEYPQPTLASVIPVTPIAPVQPDQDAAAIALQARNEQIVTADVEFEHITKIDGRMVGIIRVEVEETLGHYAEWANVRTQQIRNLNHLRFGTVLRLHQRVKIPLHRVSSDEFRQGRYEHHKRLQEDFFAVYRIGELQTYPVQSGDNYWNLCQDKFDIPMWLLKHCNPETDLADLRIRQQLIIPTIEKRSETDAAPDITNGDENVEDRMTDQSEGGV